MKLTVADRLVLLNVLPKEGDLITLRVVRDLRGELSFSEAELEAIGIKPAEDGVTWTTAADPNKDVPVGPKAREVIVGAFEALDKAKKLTFEFLPTYEKFLDANP